MRIFTPLPGEYVASALQRGNEMLGIKTLVPADFMIKAIPRKSYRRAPDDEVEYRTHALFKYPNWMIEQKTTTEILLNNTLFPITKALGSR